MEPHSNTHENFDEAEYADQQAVSAARMLIEDVELARQIAYASKDQRDEAVELRREAAKVQSYLDDGVAPSGAPMSVTDRGEYLADKDHARQKAIKKDNLADMIDQDIIDLHDHKHAATRVNEAVGYAMAAASHEIRKEAAELRDQASVLISEAEMRAGDIDQAEMYEYADEYTEDSSDLDRIADQVERGAGQQHRANPDANSPKAS